MQQIAVLGSGSWGSALALLLARNGHTVRLWSHRVSHAAALCTQRENARYLPGILFPDNIHPTADLKVAVQSADLVLLVVPSAAFGEILQKLRPIIKNTPIMWAIKGLEHSSGRLLSSVFADFFGADYPYAILSGPSFAREVAEGSPTAVTIAAPITDTAYQCAQYFHGSNFICYTSRDVVGVQIGSAVKNVIAIAVGMADGLGCGANTRAALITRGLHETTRLAVALGGDAQTLAGLSGLGDLVLTATDNQSRNRRFGLALGQNRSVIDSKMEIGQVVEGESAAHSCWQLASSLQIHMPIVMHIHQILADEISLRDAFDVLTNRTLKAEMR